MASGNQNLAALKSFSERKGWRIVTGDTRVIARGTEGGRRIHFWITEPTPRLPDFTFVAEHRSGLTLKVASDYTARPSEIDYQVEIAADGSRRLAEPIVRPEAMSWLKTHARSLRSLVPLQDNEVLMVFPETVALNFNADAETELDHRLQQLLAVADLLPRKLPHRLPSALRPFSTLIRRWAISDDQRRQARLSAASRSDLEQLAQSWRANADLINATIDSDPSSPTSVRLMAFAQAGMEAESVLDAENRT